MGRKARDKKLRPEPAQTGPPAHDPVPLPRPSARPLELWIWAAVIVAAVVAAYSTSLGNPFLLDDPINITKSPTIQRPLDAAALLRDPRALVTASLRWNYLAGGFEVAGYHVLNIASHAIAGVLVFLLARTTLGLQVFAGRYASHAATLAGVAALVFVLHPVQTESVTYVIQRAEIFVSAALAAALLAFARMERGVRPGALAALAAACVAGVYSKPSFAVVPALLAVYDVCFLSRGSLPDAARRWPAYAVATVASVLTFVLTSMHGGFEANTSGFDIEGISPLGYLAAQPGVIVHYLRVTFWPADLCFDCGYRGPWPVLATFLGDSVVVPSAILAALAAASVAAARRQPLLAFAVFGSAVVLAPTSSFVPLADFYVEHRMYLPIAFVAMALVPACYDGLSALGRRAGRAAREFHRAGAAIALVVVAVLGTLTVSRNAELGDPIGLMEGALEQAPQNERVQYNLANAYKRAGRTADAEQRYREAIRLAPHVGRSYQNLGSLYMEQGKPEAALEVWLAGAAAKPDMAMAHRNVASAYLKLDRPAEALASAERSLAIEPDSTNGRRLAGDAAFALGRTDDALAHWRAGLAARPSDPALLDRVRKVAGQ